jgi:hypothetical protein
MALPVARAALAVAVPPRPPSPAGAEAGPGLRFTLMRAKSERHVEDVVGPLALQPSGSLLRRTSSLERLATTAQSRELTPDTLVVESSAAVRFLPVDSLAFVAEARVGLEEGYGPAPLAEVSEGGCYWLRSAGGLQGIFKPVDEEAGASTASVMRRGVQVGEGATREVAAFLLDRDGFAGVPPTVVVRVYSKLWRVRGGAHEEADEVDEGRLGRAARGRGVSLSDGLSSPQSDYTQWSGSSGRSNSDNSGGGSGSGGSSSSSSNSSSSSSSSSSSRGSGSRSLNERGQQKQLASLAARFEASVGPRVVGPVPLPPRQSERLRLQGRRALGRSMSVSLPGPPALPSLGDGHTGGSSRALWLLTSPPPARAAPRDPCAASASTAAESDEGGLQPTYKSDEDTFVADEECEAAVLEYESEGGHDAWRDDSPTDRLEELSCKSPLAGAAQNGLSHSVPSSPSNCSLALPSKVGSLQAYVSHHGSAEDVGPQLLPLDTVQRVGVLDLRLLNLDRHMGNMLLQTADSRAPRASGSRVHRRAESFAGTVEFADDAQQGQQQQQLPCSADACHSPGSPLGLRGAREIRLVPIDHGLCLPRLNQLASSGSESACDAITLEWMQWPQARRPWLPVIRDYVAALDAEADVALLKSALPAPLAMDGQTLLSLRAATALLKAAVERGLTLYDIGAIVQAGKLRAWADRAGLDAVGDAENPRKVQAFMTAFGEVLRHELQLLAPAA